MSLLDSSECLNPILDPAVGFKLRRGLYKLIYSCSLRIIFFFVNVPVLPKISKITTVKLLCPYFKIELEI